MGDILESKLVAYESVLETAVSTIYTVPNTTTSESLMVSVAMEAMYNNVG